MWLLDPKVLHAMQQMPHPTAEQQLDFEARSQFSGDGPRLLTIAGSSADIEISGVLTQAPNFMAMLFGGGNTTYPDIISALATAEQDPEVKEARLLVESPGGQTDGLFDAIAAIQAFSKPLKAIVINRATSAAYALVAQTDEITANNRAVEFGSIGIAVGVRVDDSLVEITSTEAPDKRPDASTEAGKATIRESFLDPLHALFAESIATGRGTTVENVNTNFGRGATMLADDALKQGMIDSVAGSPPVAVKTPSPTGGGKARGENAMDLAQLKAEHPALYAQVAGIGQAEERDRVVAHLKMGAASGDMKTATAAIEAGDGMTASLQATYMAAGMNRADVTARAADVDEVDAALAAAAPVDDEAKGKALGAAILTGFADKVGAEVPNA